MPSQDRPVVSAPSHAVRASPNARGAGSAFGEEVSDTREQQGGGGQDENDGYRQTPMAQSSQGSQPYRRDCDSKRDQSRNEPDQLTSGEGFRTQHHHRQTADGRDQCAEMAKDDQGEASEED